MGWHPEGQDPVISWGCTGADQDPGLLTGPLTPDLLWFVDGTGVISTWVRAEKQTLPGGGHRDERKSPWSTRNSIQEGVSAQEMVTGVTVIIPAAGFFFLFSAL